MDRGPVAIADPAERELQRGQGDGSLVDCFVRRCAHCGPILSAIPRPFSRQREGHALEGENVGQPVEVPVSARAPRARLWSAPAIRASVADKPC
jgi:hypothetical protein